MINFDEIKEMGINELNGGSGITKANMFMDTNIKIMKSVLEKGCSIGEHTHKTSSEIIYIISGTAKCTLDGKEELVHKGEKMKSIFVIGDSISLYYHKYLKELFKNVAEYSRKGSEEDIKIALEDPNNPFGANGGDSRQVKEYMEKMKKENIHVDILLVNCGLHDIRTDRVTARRQVPEEEYAKNLEDIIKLGKEIAKEFIWISSTHVDDNLHQQRKEGCFRYNKDVIRYNEIANDIMKKNGIRIIDLYKFTYNLKNDNMYRDHVHYKDEISKEQAEFIFNELNLK